MDMGEALKMARAEMGPEALERLNKIAERVAKDSLRRFKAMGETITALGVLHRPGIGEREGFCGECGNVVPCQTRKFIAPFLD